MTFNRLQIRNYRLFLILAFIGAAEVLFCLLLLDPFLSSSANHDPEPFGASYHFITISYTSQRRLGNLLFQFATMMALAHQNNLLPILEKTIPLTQYFDLQVRLINDVEQYAPWRIFHERYPAKYDSGVERLPQNQDHMLVGFYQSWKYFQDSDQIIRDRLKFKEPIAQAAVRFLQYNKTDNDRQIHIGVHVRRGDILTARDIIDKGYTTPDEGYYLKAMDHFRQKFHSVQFIVVSDSSEWSQQYLSAPDVRFSLRNSPGVDLAILSMCDHVIMSVGTFGWWGAWLAGGTTIYFDLWPKKFTPLDRMTSIGDVFPESWIPMH
ncbi:hypothetical protein CAPTEDRAFT_185759 [Capitella teleta]|uniref:L-Fucosyltransferase n=1 Tax=Capitella teleta TaxID=283909 RepID=R7VHG9_CAPTE|nr:hypothetical protein CAPTEDRAFT_185759 [Capitella teleta]|eukprot:ELU18278.1 hypothetical protein CAPTEDRAFT_185759 [Capitella teleta]